MSADAFSPEANVRSPAYLVARAATLCGHCGRSSAVLALALPSQHETVEHSDSDAVAWQSANARALLFYVTDLPEDVQARLLGFSIGFRLVRSAQTMGCYWANHCEHCDGRLEDHDLHCEPDGAFVPTSDAAASEIELIPVHEPFEAAASGYALDPAFLPFSRLA